MTVSFDVESDGRFWSALEDLERYSQIPIDDIEQALYVIEQQALSWHAFISVYGWVPIQAKGENGYPGSNQLHRFWLTLQDGIDIECSGFTYENMVVVCSMVRKA